MNNNLRIEIGSYGSKNDKFSCMEDTYRDEGLSVGVDHMRLHGEDIEMEVRFEDITLGKKIGVGACSSVYIAYHNRTGKVYAVKMFNIYDRSQASQLLKEIGLLTIIDCDALISLKGAFHNEGSIGIVIEYMDRGSLDFVVRKANQITLSEEVLAAIMYQVLWGLGYLHFDNKLHRDIKPANILINSQGQVKISDFGIAKELDSSQALSNTSVGTFKYMSPERLLGARYDKSADIWSVGIMMIELWTSKYPFGYCASTPIELIGELETFDFNEIVPDATFPPLIKAMIQSMLKYNANDRSDCHALLQSKWFLKFDLTTIHDPYPIVKKWLSSVDTATGVNRNNNNNNNSINSNPFADDNGDDDFNNNEFSSCDYDNRPSTSNTTSSYSTNTHSTPAHNFTNSNNNNNNNNYNNNINNSNHNSHQSESKSPSPSRGNSNNDYRRKAPSSSALSNLDNNSSIYSPNSSNNINNNNKHESKSVSAPVSTNVSPEKRKNTLSFGGSSNRTSSGSATGYSKNNSNSSINDSESPESKSSRSSSGGSGSSRLNNLWSSLTRK